jgi:hypothetical protein
MRQRDDTAEIELLARELCLHNGHDPDRNVRVGDLASFQENGCVVLRQAFLPAWKLHIREATRMAREGWPIPGMHLSANHA